MKLEVCHIVKRFMDKEVLHGISFEVNSGSTMGFLGRNGAGKTTAIRSILNVFPYDEGEVLLDGEHFRPKDYQIGYLPEERGMYQKEGILRQLIYFSELRGYSKEAAEKSAMELLEKVGLEEYANSKLEVLSKGNQQKVQIVQALLNDPEIIILDEPFSGLDPVNAEVLKNLIREEIRKDKLILFSSHQMSHVEEFCDEITLIDQGRIVLTGNLDEIKAQRGKDKYYLEYMDSAQRDYDLDFIDYSYRPFNRGILLELPTEEDRRQILNFFAKENAPIKTFAKFYPSLQDIFVETVGDKNEI